MCNTRINSGSETKILKVHGKSASRQGSPGNSRKKERKIVKGEMCLNKNERNLRASFDTFSIYTSDAK